VTISARVGFVNATVPSGLGQISWYPRSDTTGCATPAEAGCSQLFTKFKPAGATAATSDPATAAISQGVLPLQVGDTPTHSFTPGTAAFGLQIINEFSDDSRNDTTNDVNLHACTSGCGHHMRLFPVKDAFGTAIANTWIVTIDQVALNNDFNDQVLLLTNVTPVS